MGFVGHLRDATGSASAGLALGGISKGADGYETIATGARTAELFKSFIDRGQLVARSSRAELRSLTASKAETLAAVREGQSVAGSPAGFS